MGEWREKEEEGDQGGHESRTSQRLRGRDTPNVLDRCRGGSHCSISLMAMGTSVPPSGKQVDV